MHQQLNISTTCDECAEALNPETAVRDGESIYCNGCARYHESIISWIDGQAIGIAANLRRGVLSIPLDRDFVRRSMAPVECREGCAHCCHQRVSTAPLECILIAQKLRQDRSKKDLDKLKALLAENAKLPLTIKARCPLLDSQDRCSVYSLRPLRCAADHSFVAAACVGDEASQAHPVAKELLVYGEAIFASVARACKKLNIDSGPIDLAHGVLIALERPDAAAMWLKGKDLFAPARRNSYNEVNPVRLISEEEKRRWLPVIQR